MKNVAFKWPENGLDAGKRWLLFWVVLLLSVVVQSQTFTVATCSNSTGGITYGPMNSGAAANSTNRTMVIYPSSQLAGISGQVITSLYFRRNSSGAGNAMIGAPVFKIYLKEITAADWGPGSRSWSADIIGASLVYDGNPASIAGTTEGWKNFPLTNNFTYSGTQNLAVFFEYTNPAVSNVVNWDFEYNIPCINTSNTNTTRYSNNTSGALPDNINSSTSSRPLIGFDIPLTCYPVPAVTVPQLTITANTAIASWTASVSPPANGYEYYYNTTGIIPVTNTTPSGTTGAGITTANLAGLAPGTPHYIWVRAACGGADKSPWSGTVSFNTVAGNDEAGNAILLTPNADYNCVVTSSGTTIGATLSPDGVANCVSIHTSSADVWYRFVATGPEHRISFLAKPATGNMSAALYSGTPGNLIAVPGLCSNVTVGSAFNVAGLTIGQTYYLRIFTSQLGIGTFPGFTICLGTAPPRPANDLCENAVMLTVNPDYNCNFVTAGTTKDATGSVFSCDLGLAGYDVWFKFVASNTTHWISLLNATGSPDGFGLQVWTGCGGTILKCSNETETSLSSLVPGNTYYLRIGTYDYTSNPATTFNVCIRTPPVYDDCAGAIPVPVNPTTTFTNVVTGTFLGATASIPGATNTSCGAFDDDVWFKFVATEVSHIVWLRATSGIPNLSFQILNICNATTALYCINQTAPALIYGLTPGNTYYVRVATYSSFPGVIGTFDLGIATPSAMAYVSSTTAQASTANTGAGTSNQVIIRAEVVVSGGLAPLNVTQLNFNTAGTTNAADIANARVYFTGNSLSFDPSTPFGTTITNPNGAFSVVGSQALVGGFFNSSNYFWLVYDIAGNATVTNKVDATFTSATVGGSNVLPAISNPAGTRTITGVVLNDEASGAIPLTVGGGCTGNPYNNTLASQSPAEPYPSCKGTAGYAGMWYKFVAPPGGAVKISNDGAGTLGNSRIALFSASDSSNYATFTIIACDDDNGVTGVTRSLLYAINLTPGATYWVQADLSSGSDTRGTYCVTVDELTTSMMSTSPAACSAGQALNSVNANYRGWLSLVDNSGNLNALLKQTAGNATAFAGLRTIVVGPPRLDGAGKAYLHRNFFINSTGTATTADVVLFFTDFELSVLGATLPTLNVSRVSGSNCVSNFSGSATLLTQTGNGSVNGVSWVQVTTPGFSNFYLHPGNVPLPIALESFKGSKTNSGNQLTWKVNCTSGNITFEIERSGNGRSFVSLSKFSAGQAGCATPFNFVDSKPLNGVNYYRIKMIDADGSFTYTNVVAINNRSNGFDLVGMKPTLVRHEAVLFIAAARAGKMHLSITDMVGRQFETRSVILVEGDNRINLNLGSLGAGVYYITGANEFVKSTIRFVKE